MDLKNKILQHLQNLISERISDLNLAIAAAKESRDSDTKSSVGDKHETSRALAQIEIDKLEVQLNKSLILQKELDLIDPSKKHNEVELGSLVMTSKESYFISIGIGRIEVKDETWYAISLNSPVGQILRSKKVGDRVVFQGREIVIKEIL